MVVESFRELKQFQGFALIIFALSQTSCDVYYMSKFPVVFPGNESVNDWEEAV